MQLALWSPVLCCCGIKGAIGKVTGVEGTACAADGCCAQIVTEQPKNCCDAEAGELNDSQADSDDGGCRCHDRTSERIQINTGGKVKVPNLTDHPNGLVPVAIAMAVVLLDQNCGVLGGAALRAHPPPNSLLRQHCLLLI